jgi:hypothetical protein
MPLISSLKTEGIEGPVAPPGPELEGPKAPWRVADANINRDRAHESQRFSLVCPD